MPQACLAGRGRDNGNRAKYSDCIRWKRGARWGGPRLCSPGPPGTCPMKRVLTDLPLPGKGLKKHTFAKAQTLLWWPSLKGCPWLSVADDSLARQIPHLHNIPEKEKTGSWWHTAKLLGWSSTPFSDSWSRDPGLDLCPPTWHTTQPSQPTPTHHTRLLLSGQTQARGQSPLSPCLPHKPSAPIRKHQRTAVGMKNYYNKFNTISIIFDTFWWLKKF